MDAHMESAVCGMGLADSKPLVGPTDATAVNVPMPMVANVGRDTAGGPPALSQLSGRRVRLRFALVRGDLFAFWLTHDSEGRSGGFLGGGAFGSPHIVDR